MLGEKGLRIKISGGNDEELARAARIGANNPAVDLLPRQTIRQMADLLAGAHAAVAVDTGFAHLAGALAVPMVFNLWFYQSITQVHSCSVVLLRTDFPCSPCLNRQCNYKGRVN